MSARPPPLARARRRSLARGPTRAGLPAQSRLSRRLHGVGVRGAQRGQRAAGQAARAVRRGVAAEQLAHRRRLVREALASRDRNHVGGVLAAPPPVRVMRAAALVRVCFALVVTRRGAAGRNTAGPERPAARRVRLTPHATGSPRSSVRAHARAAVRLRHLLPQARQLPPLLLPQPRLLLP